MIKSGIQRFIGFLYCKIWESNSGILRIAKFIYGTLRLVCVKGEKRMKKNICSLLLMVSILISNLFPISANRMV